VAILASLNIADELFKERNRNQTEGQEWTDKAARISALLDEVLQDSSS
jgi:cell division protein ZapA (FtsZ GTPase activity inhibitor)